MIDNFGRKIEYMRISVTDRCNLKCRYCMPHGIKKIPMRDILTYEEIISIAEAAVDLGINRFKLTGGEPLARKDIGTLVEGLKGIPGTEEVNLTTNGVMLMDHLDELIEAGLNGVNISIQSTDSDRYGEITGGGDLEKVLRTIEAASVSPLKVKLNCVLHKDIKDEDVTGLVELASANNVDIRFIEMMPIGMGKSWRGMDREKVVRVIEDEFGKMEPLDGRRGNGPARYYSLPGKDIAVGFILALSEGFCEECTRVRLDSKGKLRPCLGYSEGTDLKPYLKAAKDELREALRKAVIEKPERHCFSERDTSDNMISIGG